ncbi:hypothetical protein K470DRAFT_264938 [Piedraia hortae CBS 480.64]|uniref:BZIP domain-containing protein n=1 Tax=Piedraia hortae CBS 480.64 TaxID=1314780 RepID=A0A6A7BXJ3_9PEZI|nr:hypothetical protein K470DRAFT_264938 [Piedraia hortae CBS 480.64]
MPFDSGNATPNRGPPGDNPNTRTGSGRTPMSTQERRERNTRAQARRRQRQRDQMQQLKRDVYDLQIALRDCLLRMFHLNIWGSHEIDEGLQALATTGADMAQLWNFMLGEELHVLDPSGQEDF